MTLSRRPPMRDDDTTGSDSSWRRVAALRSLPRARQLARDHVFAHLPRPARFPPLPALPALSAAVFRPGDPGYDVARYQYATTAQPRDAMAPGAVIRPRAGEADATVAHVTRYAHQHGVAVALRSGGHCFGGTSSCGPESIQLDLAEAYRSIEPEPLSGTVRVGVGVPLNELVRQLARGAGPGGSPAFVPTGVCGGVHVGGHAQTGGVGLLVRSFGLFADHIVSARLITADGHVHEIRPDAPDPLDRELFWGVFGAGPGNFGVLTHVTLRPRLDAHHSDARSYRVLLPISDPSALAELIERLAALTLRFEAAPRGYDFGFVVFSGHESFWSNALGVAKRADLGPAIAPPVPVVAVCFQYGNTGGQGERYDPTWCREAARVVASFEGRTTHHPALSLMLRAATLLGRMPTDDRPTPLSRAMSRVWLSAGAREFRAPLLKSSVTSGGAISADFPRFMARALQEAMTHGHMIQSIFQSSGGAASALGSGGHAGLTAHSWRESACYWLFDVTFDPRDPDDEAWARAWRARVTEAGQGMLGDERARAWFGFPNGELPMSAAWPRYFDDEAKYARALRLKAEVDPRGVFSPTPLHLAARQ